MFLILTGCTSQRMSTIVGGEYNESKNQTDYFVFPLGSVAIPGKWEKTKYNTVSKQQFFTNRDSIVVAIAFSRFDKYEFNGNGSKKGYDFIEAFYQWDSKYFVDSFGLERKVVEGDSIRNFIIYQIFGFAKGGTFDTFFLIGEKNGNVTNLSIMGTDKWTKEFKIKFLKGLYLKD